VAAALETVSSLEEETHAIRVRAAELREFFDRLPALRTEAAEHRAAARAQLDQRRSAASEAAAELAEAESRGDAGRIAEAQRALTRAADAVATGEFRLARTEEATGELEAAAAAAEREQPELAARASAAAERLRAAPRVTAPIEAGDDLVDWGGRARAALFVARTGLESEREQIVREAVELGTAVLGEPVYGSTVAAVRRRLEDLA
jgi:hypothetical protein